MEVIWFLHYDVSLDNLLGTDLNSEVKASIQFGSTLSSAARTEAQKVWTNVLPAVGLLRLLLVSNPAESSNSSFNIE